MADTPQNRPPARDWRFPLTVGLAVGIGGAASRGVEKNLEPSLGYWGAFAVSIVAAGLIGGLVALVVYWLIKPGGSGST